jgi:hypothetical protein
MRNFQGNQKLTFPVLLDRDGQVGNRYHVDVLPWTVFMDRSSVIRSILRGQGTRRHLVERAGHCCDLQRIGITDSIYAALSDRDMQQKTVRLGQGMHGKSAGSDERIKAIVSEVLERVVLAV